MKRIYDYCFYRVARFYERTEGGGLFSGTLVIAGSLFWLLLAFINFIFRPYQYESSRTFYIIYSVFSVIVIYLISWKIDTEEKFWNLCEQYKGEKNAMLKGWLVFLFVLLSFSVLLLSFFIDIR